MSKTKGRSQYTATLGRRGTANDPVQITNMDITGPYIRPLRNSKYCLTLMDYFTRYAEVFPSPKRGDVEGVCDTNRHEA